MPGRSRKSRETGGPPAAGTLAFALVSNTKSAGAAPRVAFVVRGTDDPLLARGLLPSLARDRQRGVASGAHEIVLVRQLGGNGSSHPAPEALGVPLRLVKLEHGQCWMAEGLSAASAELVCFVSRPAVASPALVASLCVALDTFDTPCVRIPELYTEAGGDLDQGLAAHGEPEDGFSLVRSTNPEGNWLDPQPSPSAVALPRAMALQALARIGPDTATTPGELCAACEGTRVQLLGDALVRPGGDPSNRVRSPISASEVDPELQYLGLVVRPNLPTAYRPDRFRRFDAPRLSIVLIVHDMPREAPRTLASLLPPYQLGIDIGQYEIIVVENGSSRPLDPATSQALAPNIQYHFLRDASASPARAINFGVARSTGDFVAIAIDGACLLSPRVISQALRAARSFPAPVIGTRYFVLGPGLQRQTMLEGYDAAEEDRLLASIAWPEAGYRLFEIASPLTFGGPTEHWLTAWFESNCLFLPRAVFDRLGGCDERFDLPGGGLLNLDLFRRACELPDTQPVQLIGEGVFHQIHGGITSNTTQQDAEAKQRVYNEQYLALRGRSAGGPAKNFYFLGALPLDACRRKMRG